jgi:hypothetical protein
MYSLIKKRKKLQSPVYMQIDLFNKIVNLSYCTDVRYGFLVILIVLKEYRLTFKKYILGLKSSTPNCMVYGETAVNPLSIEIKCRIISYLFDLVIPRQNKLPCLIYRILLSNLNNSRTVSKLRSVDKICSEYFV